jgi:RecJ-like exonuclease
MKNFLKLSLICSLIGLFLIIFLANYLEPAIKNISEIDERNLDEVVKVQGEIANILIYDTLTVFTLDDEAGKIDCVFYDNLPFTKGQRIEVIGKIVEYKGKIEIEVSKINFLE